MRMRLLTALLLGVVSLTGWGPHASSAVRLDGQAVNVLFGGKPTPSATPPIPFEPGANPMPHFPSIIELPVAPTPPASAPTLIPTPAPSPCPTAARPGLKEVAPQFVTKRPALASYEFATTISRAATLPAGPESKAEGRVTRTVANVRPADPASAGPDSFLYDLVEKGADATLTTSYLISPVGVTGVIDPGLYLFSTQADTASGKDVFAPVTPLKLLPFPALEATTWRSTATDPRSQITYQISGAVVGKDRLNFCGKGVDSWHVQVQGQIAGPGRLVNINDLTYDVGTQYGGLLLRDSLQLDGYDPDGQYHSTQTSQIVVEPHAAT